MFRCSEKRKCGEPGVFCGCKCACGVGIAIVFALVFAVIVQYLWNFLAPAVYAGIGRIDYLQALALLILARILAGKGGHHGYHRWGHGCCGHSHADSCPTGDWKYYESWWDDEGKASFRKYADGRKEKDTPPSA